MEHKLKITIVGGGSTWTPGILNAFIRHMNTLPVTELVLFDSNAERQAPIGEYAQLLFRLHAPEVKVTYTTSKDAAYDSVDFVMVQIRTGGYPMREKDEKKSPWNTECSVRKPAGPEVLPTGSVP